MRFNVYLPLGYHSVNEAYVNPCQYILYPYILYRYILYRYILYQEIEIHEVEF